jgi:hypothetical protein
MIRQRFGLLCTSAAAMSLASAAWPGVWGTQPVVGMTGDYSTNPALLNVPNTAEEHGALLLDAPTTYSGDAFKLSILPSFRLSNTQGYSSLDSDYEHLTVGGEFDTERTVLSGSGSLFRDSSLYRDYLLNGSTGVRRDTASADLNGDRQLTERFDADIDLNSQRVHYAESAGPATLVDYKYSSATPTLAWVESELTKITLSAAAARYNSLDGTTESTSANLQGGCVEKLSELWTLTASAGYSRANDKIDTEEEFLEFTPGGPIIVRIPVALKSTQNGSIYAVSLNRQSEVFLLTGLVSRQLTPSGFAFLSRQDTYQVKVTYNESERLSVSGDVHRVRFQQPESGGTDIDLNITSLQISAAWQWTEHWTATVTANRVMEHYVARSVDVASSGVSIELSRQFNWKSLQ